MLKKNILNKKEEIYKRNKTCQKLYSDIQISCFYIFFLSREHASMAVNRRFRYGNFI